MYLKECTGNRELQMREDPDSAGKEGMESRAVEESGGDFVVKFLS